MTDDSYLPGRARLAGRPLTDEQLEELSTAGMPSGPAQWYGRLLGLLSQRTTRRTSWVEVTRG